MNYDVLQSLIRFAEEHFAPTSEDNETRVEELLAWIESLEESPYPPGEEPHVSLEKAKHLVAEFRAYQAVSAS